MCFDCCFTEDVYFMADESITPPLTPIETHVLEDLMDSLQGTPIDSYRVKELGRGELRNQDISYHLCKKYDFVDPREFWFDVYLAPLDTIIPSIKVQIAIKLPTRYKLIIGQIKA